ncbi:hypothetical protein PSEUBRA_001432 [Kalmanozyma brasiliensis GHG001]|uniref:Monooxygenase n=1 Tax=Kalmanozyma brasiliensis (strain GHG001) TaxID=1365824 RepID=V5EUP7_KALBG|nr:uncharacterized protein PSEUBRA_001432 [Kalmanozyma brasiliensis GHG001]EST09090.1 hypothetical protein PSEUBRA_001432 [Kalmanozyma brasiliensis GHG001]
MGSIPEASAYGHDDPTGIDDVLIVGAGISGINAACRLTDSLPHLSYTILEGRTTFGGTWDLFKYPGIRSDSDLHTFGYAFKAWKGPAIAGAPEILNGNKCWTVTTKHALTGETKIYRARFYLNCCGYYDYNQPLEAKIQGIEDFAGSVVHPQFWKLTEQDYADKKVAIIGSGATAITLLPALAGKTKHVTLVQRSPSYIAARNPNDPLADLLQSHLPETWASFLIRQRNVASTYAIYHLARTFPNFFRNLLASGTQKLLPSDVSMEKHFTPKYNPWDQRICMSPNGDFFQALREGHASIATGNITSIKGNQITLNSGERIDADIIVTATGLKLQLGGGVAINVDGEAVKTNEKFVWRGCMIENVPNFAFAMGYTNAAWTLGSDCTAHFVVRVLAHMAKSGKLSVTPEAIRRGELVEANLLDMNSTYVTKARDTLPKAATTGPWQRRTNYWYDMWSAKYASFDQLVFA